jgi:hypothetical protein
MKRVYIDEIIKKGSKNEPGPGVYNLNPSFGPKVGSQYSFRANNDPFVHYLKKSKKLPGPGNYFRTNDTVGKAHLNSRLKSSPSNAFSKAEDRFRTTSFKCPSPDRYSPKVKYQFKRPGSLKFGTN